MKYFFTFWSIILLTSITLAGTIHVPVDQPTIQAGINAAQPGDTVLVADGLYYENINFVSKAITVASHFLIDDNKKHINKTIIDGSKPANPDFGSVVMFVSGEDINSILCGFTITGGTGTVNAVPNYPLIRNGGGILCYASGARIIHNKIIGNSISGTPWAMGGGILCGPPFIPSFVELENNIIEENSVTGETRVTGGGVDFAVSGRIINNSINNNRAIALNDAPAGGGLSLQSWDASVLPPNEVYVSENRITNNKALQGDDATFWLGGIGGGIWLLGSKGVITNNIIENNEVSGALSSYGAGVLLDYPPDDLVLKNNIISENYFSGTGTCYGGGIGVWDGNPEFRNNVISKNKGSIGGGVWLGYNFCFARMFNNTFTENQATIQGGAINSFNSHPLLMNSILWQNEAPVDAELCLESGEIDVTYCDISGGWSGEGNVDSDPGFFNESYLLSINSSCVDAGNPNPQYNDPANPFRSNRVLFPAHGTVHNDLGAYGGPFSKDWHKIAKEQLPITKKLLSKKGFTVSSYPNPFNSLVTIKFNLDEATTVSLKIFNTLGQSVATLVDKKLAAGEYRYKWDAGSSASGVYFYKIKYSGSEQTEKIILVK